MTEDFSEYHAMRESGISAEQLFLKAKTNDVDAISRIRLIREVINLSLAEAKQVSLRAQDPPSSPDNLQERIADELESNGGLAEM